MIFRQLVDDDTKTYTYVIGDPWSREAVIIDPVVEQLDRDLSVLHELGLELVYALDTHVHADHVTGTGQLRARTGCKVVMSSRSGADCADVLVDDGDAVRFGLQALEVRATPGHTGGCVTYVSATRPMAFTGDALLIRGCGRTDFQEGDARTLYRSIRDKVFSLRDDTMVYPAHDYKGRTVSTIREERLYNPRLGGDRTEDQFVAIMKALDLAYPRRIDVAVPANRRCGLEEGVEPTRPPPDRTFPVHRTPTGAPVIPALWVAEHLDRIRLVDVRGDDEWNGPDGRIDHAEHVPTGDVPRRARDWDREEPIVLYCRSGGRSDRLAIDLEHQGFRRVASMAGGIVQWNALGLPGTSGGQG